MAKYFQSPVGTARHCWVNKPDTKYNADGLFHTLLVLEDPAQVAAFKEKIDAEVERAFTEEMEKATRPADQGGGGMKPGEAKKWTRYYPYEEEVDEENGNPTGRLIVKFKQNHKIKLRDGSTKTFFVGIKGKDGKTDITDNVFGGATIRVMYSPRNVKLATAKQFGVRLDFSMVQLLKAAPMQGRGFDEVDGADTPDSGDQGEEY